MINILKIISSLIVTLILLFFQTFTQYKEFHTCESEFYTVNTIEEIKSHLKNQEKIYFDIDETLVMPDTPFIYGLPASDNYIENMDQCAKDEMDFLGIQMEKQYYDSPLRLVDPEIPNLIKQLRKEGKQVLALTSRGLEEDYAWHNDLIIEFFEQNGIYFSEIQDDQGIISQTKVGGIIFSNHANKGSVIMKLQGGEPATLIDDTLKKLTKALDNDGICLKALHWTSSFSQEQNGIQKTQFICQELGNIPKYCDFCQQ